MDRWPIDGWGRTVMTPVLGELRLGEAAKLPVILSSEITECGLACLAMVARYYGTDVTLNTLRQEHPSSLAGVTLKDIIQIAGDLGFSTRPLRLELEALSHLGRPAILHWDMSHFVVLKSVGKSNITIHDPASGARTLSLTEASKHFTGVALEVNPSGTVERRSLGARLRLRDLWTGIKGQGGTLSQLALLTLAFQLAAFAAPLYLQIVIDRIIVRSDIELLALLAAVFAALLLLQVLIEALRDYVLQYVGHLATYQVTANVLRHLLRLPASWFERRQIGDVISRIGSMRPIQEALTRGVVASLLDGFMVIATALVLWVYSPVLALIVFAAVVIQFTISWLMSAVLRDKTEAQVNAFALEQSHTIETVRSVSTIALMGRQSEREGAWRNLFARGLNASFDLQRWRISLQVVQRLVTGLQHLIVVYFAARFVMAGEGFSLGMLVAFLAFRQTLSDRASSFIAQLTEFRLMGAHVERVSDIILAEPEVTSGSIPQFDVKGACALRDVSFRYGRAAPPVLRNVDLDVQPGEFVAIVGASGNGKTTLVKVLLGQLQPSEGGVELDGRFATPTLFAAWRRQIGYVAQDDRLLSGSVADNVSFFDPDLDMKRVREVCALAQIDREIERMPMQFLTRVGDMGSALSGGQRQRILLARALYRKPKLLILDEGTANIDEAMEADIAAMVRGLDMTRIVVAHRPKLPLVADRVFELTGGSLHLVDRSHVTDPQPRPVQPGFAASSPA